MRIDGEGEECRDGADVAVVYHSGTGGTETVAELLAEILSRSYSTEICSVFHPRATRLIRTSPVSVLCYPTYYLKPSRSMQEFVLQLEPSDKPLSSYLVTTCELYSENSLRYCARMLDLRGITVRGSTVIRAPGSDITCLVPYWLCPWLYRFENRLPQKLKNAAGEIEDIIERKKRGRTVPALRWYTPFTQLLQASVLNRFDRWRHLIRILRERCIRCEACIRDCRRGAWTRIGTNLVHHPERCELCTACIHHCPQRAIILIPVLKDNRRLDRGLHQRLKNEARQMLVR